MNTYKRIYDTIVSSHLDNDRQMVFLSGPRQVGKTTVCEAFATDYLNWDNDDDKVQILAGQKSVARRIGLEISSGGRKVVAFDEIHRYPRWKLFLKGFFDVYGKKTKIIVTGSAKMDVYKRGGDSLMGRYFPYRMHPLSVAELLDVSLPGEPIRRPRQIAENEWKALMEFGGFPEPFVRRSAVFSTRWHRLRTEQLLREDVRDMSDISALDQLAALTRILQDRSGEQIVFESLARDVKVSENTVKSWVSTLCALHHGFLIRPYHRHIAEAIRKTPKWFLRDWSTIRDEGKRNETFIACHLLKAVEGWTDLGLGVFELFYVRDKKKREVDFLVTRDEVPWFAVEVKTSDTDVSGSLPWVKARTGVDHAFQVVMNLPYQDVDVFTETDPVCISARTFCSQLF